MITLLAQLLILALVVGLVWYLITLIPLPAPVLRIIQVIFVIIVVLVLVDFLLGFSGVGLLTRPYWR